MYFLMIYSLKVGACLAVFYLFFKLLLSRDTFHRFNRFVVLGAMVCSFVLPLCVITIERELPVMPELAFVPEAADEVAAPVAPAAGFPWERLAGAVFLLGAAATLCYTLWSIACVLRIIGRGRRERLGDGSVVVHMQQPVRPFSWGRYIVVSEQDMAESGEEILIHERAHLRLRHSLDLVVTDIAGCLQWFNPAMWLLRRELRAIHEYEADEAVLESGVDARRYQMMLIKKAAGGRWYSVANSFNHSKLKNRITMMLQKKSSRWAGAKSLLLLPLSAIALGAFAETAYVFPEDKVKKENGTIRISGIDSATNPAPLFIVDGKQVSTESLKEIDVTRIKSMEVFKDSTATYGEEGKNGVVMLTLRKPGEAAPQMDSATEGKAIGLTMSMENGLAGKPAGVRLSGNFTLKADSVNVLLSGDSLFKGKPARVRYATAMASGDGEDNQAVRIAVEAGKAGLAAGRAGIEAGQAGVDMARKALKSVEGLLGKSELKQALKELDEAQKELDAARLGKMEDVVVMAYGAKAPEGAIGITGRSDRSDLFDKTLIVIDGKRVNKADFQSFNSIHIERLSILKDESAVAKYGEEGRNGVIEITTKTRTRTITTGEGTAKVKHSEGGDVSTYTGRFTLKDFPEDMLVFIDGRKATRADVDKIPAKKIKGMMVYKREFAVNKYGEEGRKGVIEITTK